MRQTPQLRTTTHRPKQANGSSTTTIRTRSMSGSPVTIPTHASTMAPSMATSPATLITMQSACACTWTTGPSGPSHSAGAVRNRHSVRRISTACRSDSGTGCRSPTGEDIPSFSPPRHATGPGMFRRGDRSSTRRTQNRAPSVCRACCVVESRSMGVLVAHHAGPRSRRAGEAGALRVREQVGGEADREVADEDVHVQGLPLPPAVGFRRPPPPLVPPSRTVGVRVPGRR